jgi:hypothetical protein
MGFGFRIWPYAFLPYDPAAMNVIWVSITALLAGALNAIAGGGTFIAFPALTAIGGITEKAANVACTIGLWPGSAGSIIPARHELRELPRKIVVIYALICLAGGTAGSVLLLATPARDFSLAIPWLLAFATLVFSMGGRIGEFAKRNSQGTHSRRWIVVVGSVQFLFAVYGGYFGAGMGILTLAGLSLTGLGDMRRLNALKVLLATMTNLAAAVVFLFGPVDWRFVAPMAGCSLAGGILGMTCVRRLPQKMLRGIILVVATVLTFAYFWKVYLR